MSSTLSVITVLLGTFTVTSYRSVEAQTDASPYITSIGKFTDATTIAVSQDQLCARAKKRGNRLCKREVGICPAPTRIHYLDLVYVEDVGFRFVTDCMNRRHTKRWDVWVNRFEDEKAFHKRFGKRSLKIWLIKGTNFHGEERRAGRAGGKRFGSGWTIEQRIAAQSKN